MSNTLDKVKVNIGVPLTDLNNDTELLALIEMCKEVAEEYCNNTFTEPIPSGVIKFISESIKIGRNQGLVSRSMGTVSYSFVTELPDSVYKYLAPFRKLRW